MKMHKILAVISAAVISVGFCSAVSAEQINVEQGIVQSINNDYTATSSTQIAVGYSHDSKYYQAYCPAMVNADFVVNDTKNNYVTGFDCWVEKYENKKWTKVKPLGNVIQVNGMDKRFHFYNITETGREFVCMDLALYPLLPAGKYRIAKPFWKENEENGKTYYAYYEFEMVDGKKDYTIEGDIYTTQKEYPVGVKSINMYSKGGFAMTDIYDIERKENGKWVSVRTGNIRANSIGGVTYPIGFGAKETLSLDAFDMSKAGEYRLRCSVNGVDWDSSRLWTKNYDTKYAYFKVVDNADLGKVTLKVTNTNLCEIDHEITVNAANTSSNYVKAEKAVITYKDTDGKTKSRDCTVGSYSSVRGGNDSDIRITISKDLPVGNVMLKITFSADGCKSKTFSTTFKVRKATNDERSSGVFLSNATYSKDKGTVTVIITNKIRSKETIYLNPSDQYISFKNDYSTAALVNSSSTISIKYGKSYTLTFKTYYDNPKQFVLDALGVKIKGLDDEELEFLDELIVELKNDPDYKNYFFTKSGKYTINVNYYTENSYSYESANIAFTVNN